MYYKMILAYCFFFSIFDILYAFELPGEIFRYKKNKYEHYLNPDWAKNSSFSPSYNDSAITMDLDKYIVDIGLFQNNHGSCLYMYGQFLHHSGFYTNLHSRVVSNPNLFENFSGKIQNRKRLNFNAGEINISAIGYANDIFFMEWKRGREEWGAGKDIQLVLSKNANAYDYFNFGLDIGKVRFRFLHGQLDSDSSSIHRYIIAKGLEWTNKKSMLFSITETVIYSGLNRMVDYAYLNPVSSHLEIELNERAGVLGTDAGNAIWTISADWKLNSRFRISANVLIDELVLDKSQRENNKNSSLGLSTKLEFLSSFNKHVKNSFNITLISIGIPTYRHEDGMNNFINRAKPIGNNLGSDCYELSMGTNTIFFNEILLNTAVGVFESGDNNIISSPYTPYLPESYYSNQFPSGASKKRSFSD